jgi:uncharacterized protein YdhG (YjbR/CyaY superfamily)
MMEPSSSSVNPIDAYIAAFPAEVQAILQNIRMAIRSAAPEAEEDFKYGLPTFTFHGNLVHFGAFKKHIGFYPAPSGLEHFAEELSRYKASKGAVQFPLDQPIPYDLVTVITKFRVQENLERAAAKKKGAKP